MQIDMEEDTIWEGVTDGRPETLLEMGPDKSILSYNNTTLSYMRIRHYPLGCVGLLPLLPLHEIRVKGKMQCLVSSLKIWKNEETLHLPPSNPSKRHHRHGIATREMIAHAHPAQNLARRRRRRCLTSRFTRNIPGLPR